MNSATTQALYSTLFGLIFTHGIHAGEVKIAVAANFTGAMKEVAANFEKSSRHKTIISYGSTGKLYTQIRNGAPFEVFMSADQHRPKKLEIDGLAHGRFTYAIGQLVLWSKDEQRRLSEKTLHQADFNKLALANPKTAPYGNAAITVLKRLKLDKILEQKWVIGDSIAQTYQFVATSNAEVGFVAKAQIALNGGGNHWDIPDTLYEPIRQDAVLLAKGEDNPAAIAFMAYLKGSAAQVTIDKFGYMTE
ncbi:MAG: molybdate ABC transporter substrate-binding protein [Candidatus Thiodiazotropha sp. (ex Lucinoma borealis)]|nr:molybdate ABC transporter substrate-binding protein [Candidatus Thiodiazotropha sp. (ex Lucinoma borealis)]